MEGALFIPFFFLFLLMLTLPSFLFLQLRKRGDAEFMGIERSTFLLKDGVIVKEWRGMKATGHAAQVMDALREL